MLKVPLNGVDLQLCKASVKLTTWPVLIGLFEVGISRERVELVFFAFKNVCDVRRSLADGLWSMSSEHKSTKS